MSALKPGALVWARLPGFPWWPAVVESVKKNEAQVCFCGTQDLGTVSRESMHAFRSKLAWRDTKQKERWRKKFKAAVDEADARDAGTWGGGQAVAAEDAAATGQEDGGEQAEDEASGEAGDGDEAGHGAQKGAKTVKPLPPDAELPRWTIKEHTNESGRKWKTYHGPNGESVNSKPKALALLASSAPAAKSRKRPASSSEEDDWKSKAAKPTKPTKPAKADKVDAEPTKPKGAKADKADAEPTKPKGAKANKVDAEPSKQKAPRVSKADAEAGASGTSDGSEDPHMRALLEHVVSAGGSADMLDGWYIKRELRSNGTTAGTSDVYYHNPDGRRFRSRAEVTRHLALVPGPARAAAGSSSGASSSTSAGEGRTHGTDGKAKIKGASGKAKAAGTSVARTAKPITSRELNDLLKSRLSALGSTPGLHHAFSWDAFSRLTDAEQARLLPLLPEQDRENPESMMRSEQLVGAVDNWQERLKAGEFDPDCSEWLLVMRQQQQRKVAKYLETRLKKALPAGRDAASYGMGSGTLTHMGVVVDEPEPPRKPKTPAKPSPAERAPEDSQVDSAHIDTSAAASSDAVMAFASAAAAVVPGVDDVDGSTANSSAPDATEGSDAATAESVEARDAVVATDARDSHDAAAPDDDGPAGGASAATAANPAAEDLLAADPTEVAEPAEPAEPAVACSSTVPPDAAVEDSTEDTTRVLEGEPAVDCTTEPPDAAMEGSTVDAMEDSTEDTTMVLEGEPAVDCTTEPPDAAMEDSTQEITVVLEGEPALACGSTEPLDATMEDSTEETTVVLDGEIPSEMDAAT